MIRVTISRDTAPEDQCVGLSVLIPDEHAPALRSAVEELRNIIGGRLEGSFEFAREDALTRAASAVGELAAGFNRVIPEGDPYYE